jgi:membrane fusion protein, heavy metal efflux system
MKYIFYILPAVFLLSCTGQQPEEPASNPPGNEQFVSLNQAQILNAGIATGSLEQNTITSMLKVNGIVEAPPQNKVSVSLPFGGHLKEIKLLPGMQVQKGQTIAIAEDPLYIKIQEEFLIARSKLLFAEAEYNRQKEMNQSKAASDKAFQLALADYSEHKVLLKSLAEKLKLIGINPEGFGDNNISRQISILSPISGYVSKVNVNVGKYASPETVLFEIIDPEDMHLTLAVFERDIQSLLVGQKVLAYTNTAPEKIYEGEVILIGKIFSESRSVEVHCHFNHYDQILIPGMYMNAEVERQHRKAYVLPSAAIVANENKSYIFARRMSNTFELIEVKPGDTENGLTEIHNWERLKGREIVTKGAYWLLMKLKGEQSD